MTDLNEWLEQQSQEQMTEDNCTTHCSQLKVLAEILRYEAEKRFKVNPHDSTAHILHELSNVITKGLEWR